MQKLNKNQIITRGAMLCAVTVLLASTPLGYIAINPALTVTIMVLPVGLGGLMLSWPFGLFLGLVFGISSFLRAGFEGLGVILLQQSVFLSFLTCVLPRLAVGLFADFCGKLLRKNAKLRRIWFYAFCGFMCSFINTVLFLGFIWLLFNSNLTGITLGVLLGFVASNGLLEMLANSILLALIAKVLLKKSYKAC